MLKSNLMFWLREAGGSKICFGFSGGLGTWSRRRGEGGDRGQGSREKSGMSGGRRSCLGEGLVALAVLQ